MKRHFLIALLSMAVVLVATVPVSFAATQARSAPTVAQKQAVIDLAAAKLGLTSDQLTDALKQARKDLGLNQGRPRAKELVRDELAVAAKTIGFADVKALHKELRGSTLEAVAQKHNVAPSAVAAAIKADIDAKIQALVTAGTLKADRAAALKTKAEAKVDALMTHEFKSAKS